MSTPGDDLVRKGDFHGAAADFVKQLAEKPDDSSTFIRLGILQAEMGDAEAYRSHCHALLGKSDPNADVRSIRGLSKLCLLAPLPEADTRIAVGLADLALSKTTESRVIAQALLGKGLAEYRGGHYPEAIQWMEKAIASPSESSPTSARNVSGAAYAIVAAACYKLHEPDKAREALFQATEGLKGKWLSPDMTDLGDHWQDVVVAHLLLREARICWPKSRPRTRNLQSPIDGSQSGYGFAPPQASLREFRLSRSISESKRAAFCLNPENIWIL